MDRAEPGFIGLIAQKIRDFTGREWVFEAIDALLEVRRQTHRELWKFGDLTGYSAILYGDAASKHRRDLVMAA